MTYFWEPISSIFARIESKYCAVVVQKSCKKEIMPARCVAANCGNRKDKARNISVHRIPFYSDTRPEAQKRRKRWVDWVKLKRAKWEPSQHSHLCSAHFKEEDFLLQFGNEVDLSNRWLLRDDLGVCVFPSVHSGAVKEKPLSARDKRMVSEIISLLSY